MRRLRSIAFVLAGSCLFLAAMFWTATGQDKPDQKLVNRGKYLVNSTAGCNDCHTPWKMGPKGPEPDMTRFLSGHPQDMALPPPPAASGPWIGSFAASMTAWAGPWGVSFTRNLTPDKETGLGDWTEENFISTLRNGKRMGKGRDLLPPMPWQVFKNLTDSDLKAIFAYLKTIPAVKNKVPEPIPPAGQPAYPKQP